MNLLGVVNSTATLFLIASLLEPLQVHSFSANSMPNNTPDPKAAVAFARLIGKLKTTPRTGWVRRGVPRYESVADHSWRVAALGLLLMHRDDLQITQKLLPMALLHDIGEAVVGDIPPEDNVSKEE